MTVDVHQGLEWQCGAGAPIAERRSGPLGDEVVLEADGVEAEIDSEAAILSGNVRITHGDRVLNADRVRYDRAVDQVDAAGNVVLSQPGLRVAGARATYSPETERGAVDGVRYRLTGAQDARGTATRATLTGPGAAELDDITYTTCRPGQDHWQLSAERLALDQDAGVGTAHGAVMRLAGAPVLYLPWLEFPIDDRRRSGFLPPSLGSSDSTGIDVSLPYYLNLAPNYDLTLVPRFTDKRGAILGGEFRFLTPAHEGRIRGEYLPDDSAFAPGGDRGALDLTTRHALTPRWRARSLVEYVSDDEYPTDLGSSLAETSATDLERIVETEYLGDGWSLLARLQDFQTIGDDIDAYTRLPEILFDAAGRRHRLGLAWDVTAEFANFRHNTLVEGTRYDFFPRLSLPLRKPWGYLQPTLGARLTGYDLRDTGGADTGPDRLLPVLSLDSGLYFERDAQLFGHAVTQLLEPRLFYLYVPHENQDDLPVFDTELRDFAFDNLFRSNRFTGPDRMGDANQLTLALTSRTLAQDNGTELLVASLGGVYSFTDQRIALPGDRAPDDGQLVYAGEVRAQLTPRTRAWASAQWNPDRGIDELDQAELHLNYRVDNNRLLNAAYRVRRGLVRETDVSAIWPLSDRIIGLARWNYSWRDDRILETLAGIAYRDCCWGVRALVRHYATGPDDDNLSFLLQFELRGLGRFGDKIQDTLRDSVYGYRTDED